MGAPAITMDVRRVGETTAVVDIRGEVTAACEPVLMSAYEAAGGSATSKLVLNFAGLEYMNSGGIGMLVTLLVRANRQRQQLAAYGLSEHYREIFELTRLDVALGGHRKEDKFWAATLTALGRRLGLQDPKVETRSTCVDSKRQWRHSRNVWHNSMVRSVLQTLAAPVTGLSRAMRGRKSQASG